MSQPIERLEAQASEREVSFVAALDGAAVAKIMTIAAPMIVSAAGVNAGK
jgi:hypothetical protein